MSCPPRIPNEYASNSGFDPLYGVCVCVYLLVCDCTYLFIYFVEGRCGGWVGVLQDEILEASRKVFDVEIPHRVVYIKKSPVLLKYYKFLS